MKKKKTWAEKAKHAYRIAWGHHRAYRTGHISREFWFMLQVEFHRQGFGEAWFNSFVSLNKRDGEKGKS